MVLRLKKQGLDVTPKILIVSSVFSSSHFCCPLKIIFIGYILRLLYCVVSLYYDMLLYMVTFFNKGGSPGAFASTDARNHVIAKYQSIQKSTTILFKDQSNCNRVYMSGLCILSLDRHLNWLNIPCFTSLSGCTQTPEKSAFPHAEVSTTYGSNE